MMAQTVIDWIDSGGGSYNDPSNWNPQSIPDSTAESARFNLNDTLSIFHEASRSISDLIVSDGEVFFTRAATPIVAATYTADDDILVEGGMLSLANFGNGQTLQLVANDLLSVAEGGILDITDGNTVEADSLRVGGKSFGIASSTGRLTVDGTGSALTVTGSETTVVGASSQIGEFVVRNNASASFGNLDLAASATTGVSADVDILTGGEVSVAGDLSLVTGNNNNQSADLLVDGGGTMFTVNGEIDLGTGSGTNQTAAITVSNSATFMQTNGVGLNLGGTEASNSATLTVTSGGTFTAGNAGTTILDNGTLNIDGGTFNTNDGLNNSTGGTLNHTDGTLAILSGAYTPKIEQPIELQFLNAYVLDGPTASDVPVLMLDGSSSSLAGTGSAFIAIGLTHRGAMEIRNGAQATGSLPGLLGFESGSNGSLTVTDAGSIWNSSSSMTVGESGQGTLRVEGGGQVFNTSGELGAQLGSMGFADVSGDGSHWHNSSFLTVGQQGQGTLNVFSEGQVTSESGSIGGGSTGSGQVVVTGSGSNWTITDTLFVGNSGDGTLNISDNGQVSSSQGFIGLHGSATSEVTVTDSGSTWANSGDLHVSFQAGGRLNVEAGATVSNVNGFIGDQLVTLGSDGEVTVTGAGSTWSNSGDLRAGTLGGPATLTISDGGLVTVGGTTFLNITSSVTLSGGRFEFGSIDYDSLARVSGTSGSLAGDLPTLTGVNDAAKLPAVLQTTSLDFSDVRLSNQGLLFGEGNFTVALSNAASAEVEVTTGERLRFDGNSNANAGQITLTGGQLHFTQDLTNSAGGLVIGNGTLRADGGLTNEGDIALSATANIIGDVTNNANGTIISAGGTTTFFDDVVNNGEIRTNANSFTVYFGSYSGNGDTGTGTVIMEGDLKPGSSPGTMTFGGDLSFGPAAGLEIEIGGLSAVSEYDRVEVAAFASLDGTLDVSLINGFEPEIGDTFGFLFASGGFGGMFDTLNLPDIGPGKEWLLNPGGSTLFLEVRAAFSADFDLDGDVDGDDLTQWQGDYGVNDNSDADADGDSDGADLLAWQRQFGSGVSSVSATQSVPEPATALLSLWSLLLLVGFRWNTTTSSFLE